LITAGIVKYMRAQVGPASKDLSSLAAYEKFLAVQEAGIVGFFEKESDLKGVFTKYADMQREKLRFGHSSNPEVLGKIKET
jgi:protein disulfide-isomerase A3